LFYFRAQSHPTKDDDNLFLDIPLNQDDNVAESDLNDSLIGEDDDEIERYVKLSSFKKMN
jgi:hypothetical protein